MDLRLGITVHSKRDSSVKGEIVGHVNNGVWIMTKGREKKFIGKDSIGYGASSQKKPIVVDSPIEIADSELRRLAVLNGLTMEQARDAVS